MLDSENYGSKRKRIPHYFTSLVVPLLRPFIPELSRGMAPHGCKLNTITHDLFADTGAYERVDYNIVCS